MPTSAPSDGKGIHTGTRGCSLGDLKYKYAADLRRSAHGGQIDNDLDNLDPNPCRYETLRKPCRYETLRRIINSTHV